MKCTRLETRFVSHIPEQLEEGVWYVSLDYAVAAHRCCCGCGAEIVTPFTPKGWKITFDGESLSLWPSVGNWTLPCRSHYVIKNNRVIEIPERFGKQTQSTYREDRDFERLFFPEEERPAATEMKPHKPDQKHLSFWAKIKKGLSTNKSHSKRKH
jgi:hypothetical protein